MSLTSLGPHRSSPLNVLTAPALGDRRSHCHHTAQAPSWARPYLRMEPRPHRTRVTPEWTPTLPDMGYGVQMSMSKILQLSSLCVIF